MQHSPHYRAAHSTDWSDAERHLNDVRVSVPNTVNAGRRQLPRTPTPAETGRRRAEEYLNQVGV